MPRAMIMFMLLFTMAAGSADAGVRGREFTGTINAVAGNSAETVLDFAAIGNARSEVQSIGGIPNAYPGTYTELDFGMVSYWTGTFTGAPTYEVSGFCFFSFVSTYRLTNSGAAAASGYVVRSGIANVGP